jgi:hypothetical protein
MALHRRPQLIFFPVAATATAHAEWTQSPLAAGAALLLAILHSTSAHADEETTSFTDCCRRAPCSSACRSLPSGSDLRG